MLSYIRFNLNFFLNKKLKLKLLILFFLNFINTVLDIISVASIPAFLIFFFNKRQIEVEINYINDILNYVLGIIDKSPVTLIFLFFILFFIIKTLLSLLYYVYFVKFGYELDINISKRIVKKKLETSYLNYVQSSYSSFLNLTTNVLNDFVQNNFIVLFQIIVNSVTIFIFLIFLLLINPATTVSILTLTVIGSLIYYLITKKKFIFFGKHKIILHEKILSKIKDIYYAFKEIKIYGKEESFIDNFLIIKKAWASNKIRFQVISNLPKIFLELILVIIVIIIFFLSNKLDLKLEVILINITLFLVSAQRLFPRIMTIVRNYSKLNYSSRAQKILVNELEKENLQKQKKSQIIFKDKIRIENVNFGYSSEKIILENINLEIQKGSFIGIKGDSGEGKSTLINLIMGLLEPSNGNIFIDDTNISKNIQGYMDLISYIPQKIYILNDTIRNNLVFANDQINIDENDLGNILNIVKLNDLIKDNKKKFNTAISDATFKASEGEIQRFGIARALLQKKEILILDEITSSLDQKNEKNIMNIVRGLKGSSTIIMISHKNSSLEFCDKVYTVHNKNLLSSK